MTVQAYNQGLLDLVDGTTAFGTDGVYAALVDETYTFDATHTEYSNITSAEVTDSDYSPQEVTNKTVTLDNGDVLYDCDDVTYGTDVTISANGIVFLQGDHTDPQSSDRLLFYWDFGGEESSTNSTFEVTTPAGLYRIQPQ